jgi:hypothetical protein
MSETTHITDHQELLADFVLGRISDEERSAWEGHLTTCPSCTEAVRRERALAAGVRRAGRDRLKARLAETGRSMERPVPWPRILSVAAVLAIAVGVGIFEHWFAPESLPVAALDQRPINAQRDVPYQPPEGSAATSAPQRREARSDKASKPDVRVESNIELKAEKQAETGISPGIAAMEAPAAAPAKTALSLDDKVRTRAVWIEGNRLQEDLTGGGEVPVSLQSNAPAGARALGKLSEEHAKKSKDQSGAATDATAANSLRFSIQQRPVSQLPRAQQAVTKNSIQTMVVRRGDSLALTLYLDSLLDEHAVQNARVNQVGTDSVVVEMGGQKIGYRLR